MRQLIVEAGVVVTVFLIHILHLEKKKQNMHGDKNTFKKETDDFSCLNVKNIQMIFLSRAETFRKYERNQQTCDEKRSSTSRLVSAAAPLSDKINK